MDNVITMDKVIDFINVNRDRYLEELKALLAIPSISALPEHKEDVRRCAEWCAAEMRRRGERSNRRRAGSTSRAAPRWARTSSAGRSAGRAAGCRRP